MSDNDESSRSRQYITFMANGQEYAANIMMIREIRGWTDTTALPHVPDYVRGVINLRGTVLPVIDLKARLGLGMTEATIKHVIVVVAAEGRTIGILVDAVSDILTLSDRDIRPPPDVMQGTEDKYVEGIAVIDHRMVILLGVADIMQTISGDIAFAA